MIDFSRSAESILRLYSTPDVAAQRRELVATISPVPGARILDVGSGPGLLAADLAPLVGHEGLVLGVDPSQAMVSTARTVAAAPAAFSMGEATALPVASEAFDALTCTQVLEYVPDVSAALAEFRRVLRPGAQVAIIDTDWDSVVWRVADRARLRRIIDAWDEHCAHPHLPTVLRARLLEAGFELDECRVIVIVNTHFGGDTYSGPMARTIAAFASGRRGVRDDDSEGFLQDLQDAAEAGEYFFSLSRYLFTARRP